MNRLRQALAQRNGKTLLGAACYFYDPIFLEIAAHVGFDAIWIEMEHAAISFAEAGDLCRMATGTGMLTMIRVPDTRRDSILKSAELGPDIIDVPMVDTAGTDARDVALRALCSRRCARVIRLFPRRQVWNGRQCAQRAGAAKPGALPDGAGRDQRGGGQD